MKPGEREPSFFEMLKGHPVEAYQPPVGEPHPTNERPRTSFDVRLVGVDIPMAELFALAFKWSVVSATVALAWIAGAGVLWLMLRR